MTDDADIAARLRRRIAARRSAVMDWNDAQEPIVGRPRERMRANIALDEAAHDEIVRLRTTLSAAIKAEREACAVVAAFMVGVGRAREIPAAIRNRSMP